MAKEASISKLTYAALMWPYTEKEREGLSKIFSLVFYKNSLWFYKLRRCFWPEAVRLEIEDVVNLSKAG